MNLWMRFSLFLFFTHCHMFNIMKYSHILHFPSCFRTRQQLSPTSQNRENKAMLLPEHWGGNSWSASTISPQSLPTLDEWVLCFYCFGVWVLWFHCCRSWMEHHGFSSPLLSTMSPLQCILPHCAWMSFPVLPGGLEVEVPPTLASRSSGSFSSVPAVTPAGSGHSTKLSGQSSQNCFNPGLWSLFHTVCLFVCCCFLP